MSDDSSEDSDAVCGGEYDYYVPDEHTAALEKARDAAMSTDADFAKKRDALVNKFDRMTVRYEEFVDAALQDDYTLRIEDAKPAFPNAPGVVERLKMLADDGPSLTPAQRFRFNVLLNEIKSRLSQ